MMQIMEKKKTDGGILRDRNAREQDSNPIYQSQR